MFKHLVDAAAGCGNLAVHREIVTATGRLKAATASIATNITNFEKLM